uniref:Integral membrane protein n=1 Tax=Streptomyces sp. NBC_00049 TaxID=2903617 RepID=A0AAU2JTP4_9ACTN
MPDRRQPDSSTDDNPFAAPPEGRPDQPWQPRAGGDGGGPGPGDGPPDPGGQGGPARWDPTDPIQRRARYALLAGMWGFFFGIFGIPSVGLLLGALALYWGITALRGKPVPAAAAATDAAPAADAPPQGGLAALGPAARPQRTAAVSGLVTASLAILLAMSSYALQLAYKDFYVCRDDALTKSAELQCNTLLPANFVGDILKVRQ